MNKNTFLKYLSTCFLMQVCVVSVSFAESLLNYNSSTEQYERIVSKVIYERTKASRNAKRREEDVRSVTTIKVAMGSTLEPMHYIDGNNELVGFEVDLVKMFAKSIGKQVEIIDPYELGASSLSLLISGKVDMAVNSLDVTEDRQQWVVFSLPYFASRTGLVVNSNAPKETDLANMTHIRLLGSRAQFISYSNSRYISDSHSPQVYVNDLSEAYNLIESEHYSKFRNYVFAYDSLVLKQLDKNKYSLLDIAVGGNYYGAAFRKNDFAYNLQWDDFVSNLMKTGAYEKLYDKWFNFTQPEVIKLPKYKYIERTVCWDGMPKIKWYHGGEVVFEDDVDFSNDLVEYLPFMSCGYRAEGVDYRNTLLEINNRYYEIIYPYVRDNFRAEYGSLMEELLRKVRPDYTKNKIKSLYDELTLEKGIVELLKHHFKEGERGIVKYDNYFISAFYLKHPQLRDDVVKAYQMKYAEVRRDVIDFVVRQEMEWPTISVVLVDTHEKKRNINLVPTDVEDVGHGEKAYRIRVLKNDESGKPIIKVKGFEGRFVSMTVKGGGAYASILNADGSEAYPIYAPGSVTEILSDSGAIISEYGGFQFHSNQESGAVVKILKTSHDIHRHIMDKTNIVLTDVWMNKFREFVHGVGGDGTIYLLESFTKTTRKQSKNPEDGSYDVSEQLMRVYKKDGKDGDFTVVGELNGGSYPRYRYLIDGKLFLSSIGYDDAYPPTVIDLSSGEVNFIEEGVGGAAMVPIGEHEILYCGGSQQLVINTKTLKKTFDVKINAPCPGKTGAYMRHPQPGYFVYLNWELC